MITTVAGNGITGFGGPATQAGLNYPTGVAVAADSRLYIADYYNDRIRQISSVFENAVAGDTVIISADGLELYYFDSLGRHQRTVDAVTGADRYRFAYDSDGDLLTVTDRDGDLTRIARDATGAPAAIVAPDGQRTELTLTAEGYLASVTNAANETYRLDYYAGGLLKTVTDPKGHGDHFVYDATGRLVRNTNAGHGGWTIARTEEGRGYTASMTSAEARTSRFKVERLAIGDRRQVNTAPNGTVETKLFKTNGEETTTTPDGTVTTVLEGPDPRFGMQAPLPQSVTVKTPSGLTSTTTTARTTSLADPNDPLTLTALSDTVMVNGKAYKRTYEASARTWTRSTPAGRLSTIEIDAKGRPVVNQVPGLAPSTLSYDTRGRLIEMTQDAGAEPRTSTIHYYASGPQKGYVQSLTDALGRSTLFDYDVAGRVTRKTLPDGREVRYEYDGNGNLTALHPPGQPPHLFDYTALDQEAVYTPPTSARAIRPRGMCTTAIRISCPSPGPMGRGSSSPTTAAVGCRR